MMYNMSIYIPSVTPTTTEEQVRKVFYNLWLGQVSRVDFVDRDDSANRMAFVHFDYWYQHANAYYLQKHILENGQSRIVYNDPHYWIVMKNNTPLSAAEVELDRRIKFLENEVFELSKKNAYLTRVIETHTRTFMDNGIITRQIKHCDDCLTEMPLENENCDACESESIPNLEPPRAETPPPRPRSPEEAEAEAEADALALTGALSQSQTTYIHSPHDSSSDIGIEGNDFSVKDPLFDDIPADAEGTTQPARSAWFFW